MIIRSCIFAVAYFAQISLGTRRCWTKVFSDVSSLRSRSDERTAMESSTGPKRGAAPGFAKCYSDVSRSFIHMSQEVLCCYRILMLCLALKMPTARTVFLQCWKDKGGEATVGVLFETLSAFAASMSRQRVEEETRQIGGPLYAHGWQMVRHL